MVSQASFKERATLTDCCMSFRHSPTRAPKRLNCWDLLSEWGQANASPKRSRTSMRPNVILCWPRAAAMLHGIPAASPPSSMTAAAST